MCSANKPAMEKRKKVRHTWQHPAAKSDHMTYGKTPLHHNIEGFQRLCLITNSVSALRLDSYRDWRSYLQYLLNVQLWQQDERLALCWFHAYRNVKAHVFAVWPEPSPMCLDALHTIRDHLAYKA